MGSYHYDIVTVRYSSMVHVILLLLSAWKIPTTRESSVSSCKISPTQDLIIIEGETSSITCTVTGPCQNLSNAYFHSPNASITDILKTNMFDEIHSNVSRTEDHINDSCSFSIDLYWTQDEQIRSKLPSLQCVFTFKDGAMSPCITGTISITFEDHVIESDENGDDNNFLPTDSQTPTSMNSSLGKGGGSSLSTRAIIVGITVTVAVAIALLIVPII